MSAESDPATYTLFVDDYASMGPHSDECGILLFQAPPKAGAALQWGRTLMSAESALRRSIHQGDRRASMGPHSDECGIDLGRRAGRQATGAASMGPHSDECGIGST